MKLKALSVLLFAPAFLVAQSDSPVTTASDGLPSIGYQRIMTYATTNLIYECVAASAQAPSTVTVTAATNTNPVVFTATAHGFDFQTAATTTPAIFISGATGSWTGINGLWIATPTSANAFSIPVDSTAFGSFSGQNITVTTLAPRTNQKIWAIQALKYNASNVVIWKGWAVDTSGTTLAQLQGGSPAFKFACASETTYAYQ